MDMKHGVNSLSPALILALTGLMAAPLAARADANPDFEDDARPILNIQPGLVQYVESHYEVKDTGTAKFPGDDDRRPAPPFIFRARPLGSHGPYNLRLLIQPGPPGHILGVVDINKVRLPGPGSPPPGPAVANQPPSSAPGQTAPSPSVQVPELAAPPVTQQPGSAQAPASAPPTEPTADTPSGPIMDSGAPANNAQSDLAPPPDPAPNTH